MDSFRETTIRNPAFQDMEEKSHEKPSFYGESSGGFKEQKPSTQSESRSGNRIFIILMATACLLSITSLVLTLLMMFGKIPTFETMQRSQRQSK